MGQRQYSLVYFDAQTDDDPTSLREKSVTNLAQSSRLARKDRFTASFPSLSIDTTSPSIASFTDCKPKTVKVFVRVILRLARGSDADQ